MTNILVIEDNPGDLRLILDMLESVPERRIQLAGGLAEAEKELVSSEWQVVFLNLTSPDAVISDWIPIIRINRPDAAIVALLDNNSANIASKVLRLGADDFLVKPQLSRKTLEECIQYSVRKRRIENERDVFFSVSLDMICIASPDGYFTQVNPAFLSILGYTSEQLCSQPILSFLHPDDISRTSSTLEKSSNSNITSFENRYRCKDGTYKQLSWKSKPFAGRIYATARDVTEQKKLEAGLIEADRMVSLGTLAAGVAHEINNPLAYALVNLNLMMERLSLIQDPSLREQLLRALEGTNRVRDIVCGLKIFSRDEGEKVELVDLRIVLDTAINLAMHEIQPRAKLLKEFFDVPQISGNAGRLGQVFLNLLINAAQAIPEGKADVEVIRVRTYTDSSGDSVVEVQDTGEGMSEATRAKIFDPFFTTKPIGTGTGLGLSISLGIINSHNGKIEVDSEQGKGTTFRITLPKALPTVQAPIEVLTSLPKPVGKLRILILDDEVFLAQAIRAILESDHHVDVETESVKGLNRILADAQYDLILCDLMMPRLTGMEIYLKLSEDGRGFEKRIVFMTGGAYTPRMIEFAKTTSNPCISKPFEPRELKNLIAQIARSK